MAKAPPAPGTLGFKAVLAVTKLNTVVYRASGGRIGSLGQRLCILHHRGARSGEARETPLYGIEDGDDMVLVASYGGAPKSPAWFHNCMAHPDVDIERNGKRVPMRARRADAAERERLWPKAVASYGAYADYQEITEREIPVVICSPR